MKKLLLFCLLSVFMSMTYVSNAQSPGSGCCFWLENAQPDTPADIYNLNPMATSQNEVQYYYFKFDNTCGLDPFDKISIDWQITINGQPVDAITLGQLGIEIETKNPYLNLVNNDGFVSSQQLRSGQGFNSALLCPNKTDYPGGLGGAHPNTYCPNTQEFSYYNLSPNNLYNYFYVHFLQYASDNNLIRLKINRKSWAVNFKINVQLIERTGGEAYENDYRTPVGATHYYMGGKLAQRGAILGNFTLEEQTYLQDSESACSGIPIEVGMDPNGDPYTYVMYPTTPDPVAQMVVNVPFYNQTWDCVNYIDQMVEYTLTWAPAPSVPTVLNQTRCGAGTVTFSASHVLEGTYNFTYNWYSSSVISPANLVHTGNTFTTPALAEDQEVHYWVTASNVGCEGLPLEVTAKAFKQPIVTLTNPSDLCPDAGNKIVMAVVTNAYDIENPGVPTDLPAIPAQHGFDLTVDWTGATQTSISNGTIYANVPVTNACNATYTYTVTITDDVSGCTASATGEFTLVDTEAPTFDVPQAYTAEKGAGCALDIEPQTTGVPQNIDDNCTDPNFVITHTDVVNAGTCPDNYTITRTWSVADHCGNATTHNQIITVVDLIAPSFTVPADRTVYTDATCAYNALPAVTGVPTMVTDNCTAAPNVTFDDAIVDGNCEGTFVITRTWTVTDACGNATSQDQMITVSDNTPPTFVVPIATTVYTNSDCVYNIEPSVTGVPTSVDDNCSSSVDVDYDDQMVAGTCEGAFIVTRTWIVTDNCNNITTATQTINIVDNTPPTFTVPANTEIFTDANCDYDASVAETGDVTDEDDNCSQNLDATYSDVVTNGSCAGEKLITRTWTLVDDCSNTTTHVQLITVTDNMAPTFEAPVTATIYKDATCTYNADPTITGVPTAVDDNCTQSPVVSSSDVIVDGACEGTLVITRTWTVTDACDNASSQTQTIYVLDNTVPTFTVPADITIYKNGTCGYDASVAVTGDVTDEADNCSTGLNAVFSDEVTAGACFGAQIITRTWTLTDDCDNVTTKVQIITALDNTAPTFTVPADITIYKNATCEYDASVGVTGDVTDEADNCSTGLQAVFTDAVAAGTCTGAQIITRTWTLTDACNNVTTKVQIITALDNTAPTFTAPENITIFKNATCGYDASVGVTGDVTNELDNCSTGLQAVFTDAVAPGACEGLEIITRTWTLTDDCNNVTTHIQTITVRDNTAPTFTVPVATTINLDADCVFDASPSITGNVTDEADNCTTVLDATYTDVYTAGSCPTSSAYITRTWRLEDACGNITTQNQTISITDVTKPTFTVPADIAICKTPANTYNAATTITGDVTDHADNCTAQINLVLNYSDVVTLGTATEAGSIVRTWTVTDACLNTETKVQTITLNPAPVAEITVTPTPSFCLPETGSVDVTATLTGTPATSYTYSITLPNTTSVTTSTATQQVSTAGVYTFTGFVTNTATGCASAVVEVSTEALLYPDFTISNVVGKRGCRDDVPSLNGSFNVTNNALYTYTISPNVGSYSPYTFSNLPIGNYNVTATHTNGCSYTQPQAIVFDPSYTPVALFELGGRDADTAVCWTTGLYLSTLVTDLNNVFAHTYNYHIIVPVNVTALGSNGVRIEQPGVYAIGAVVENVTTGCRDTAWHYVYAMAYPSVDVTAEPFCLNTEVDLTMTALPVLVAPHSYSYAWTSTNTGATVLGTNTTLSHLTTVENKYYGAATAHYAYSGLNVYGQTLTFNLACTSRDSVTVTPLPLPVFTAAQSAAKRVCNANDPGAITINSGWNATYTWTLTRVATGSTSTITSSTFNVPDSGYYHITAVDLNGCTFTLNNIFVGQEYVGFNAILHADILPLVAPEDKSANLTLCWDDMDERLYHEIRYTNNPIFSYQYTIITPNNIDQVSSTYSLIRASGTYLMSGYVTNLTTGCVSNIDTLMVYAVPTPVYTISPDATICRGESTTVGITPTSTFTTVWAYGSTTADQLTITPAMYGAGNSFTANVTVTATLPGADFGCTRNDEVVITINNQPVIDYGTTDVLCNGGNTGAINLDVTGSDPLTFLWSTGATTEDISGLSAGLYNVTVTDMYGCTSVETGIEIEQPDLLEVEISSFDNVSCFAGNDGEAIASATGGFGSYTYTWSNSTVGAENVGLIAGTYTVTVKDANNCTATAEVTITQPEILSETAIVTDNVCYGGNIGAIDLTVNGGTSPYSYTWSNTALTQDISSLTAGTYDVTVTDSKGCTVTASYTVNQPDELDATVASTNVLCNGANDGTITITSPTGGSGSYEYRLNSGTWQSSGSFTGLPNATYSVQIRDANATACVITLSTEFITQPTLLTASITAQTNVACFGLSTGSATVTPVGGTLSYSYSWGTTPVQTDATATGLAEGSYIVTVTDGYGCTATATAIITQPLDITLNTPIYQPIACNGGSTTVNMTATGGTGTLTYTFNGSSNTTGIFNSIGAGTYDYSVTDANSCGPKTGSITIGQPTAVTASISTYEDLDCYAVSTGTATVSASGGTPGYTYLWSNAQTSAQATGLSATTYSVTVYDANSCSASTSVTLTQPDAIVLSSATVTSTIPCNGGTGTVTIIATGGTGTIEYTFNSETNTTGIFTGVLAGNHPYSITDVNGCGPVTGNVNVTEPALLTVSFTGVASNTCNGGTIGTATASPAGGTTTYNYAWSTGATTPGISSLGAATYSVTITDARGCTTSNSVEITEPAILNATVNATNVSCNGGSNGAITISSPTGGFGTYQFRLNTGSWQSGLSFTGLNAGTYSVQIRDAAYPTCFIVLGDQVITEPTVLTATISAQTNVLCYGNSTGAIDLDVTGGTGPYTYVWTPAASSQDLSDIPAGLYTVTVTDANACTAIANTTITQPAAALVATISAQTNVLCYGNSTGAIDLGVTGGTGAYTYSWSPAASTQDLSGLPAGLYSVTVTDANGCTSITSTTITQPAAPLVATISSQTDVLCFGNSTGAIDLSVTGGTGAYNYAWTPSAIGQDLTNISAGLYSVIVTDANGCTATASTTITQPTAALVATVSTQTNVLCYGNSTGTIDLGVTGGTGAYTYSWSPAASTQDLSGLPAGLYSVTVTDANGCTSITSTTITQPVAPLVATISSQTNVLCYGNSTGAIDLGVTGGTGAYTYSWSPAASTQDLSGLPAGLYSVTVTDDNGCTSITSTTITQPAAALVATISSQTNVLCYGSSTGVIDLGVTGGTGAYGYVWTPSGTTQDLSGLAAGIYSVVVTDANGCTATASTTITQPDAAVTATTTPTHVKCFAGNDGSAEANPTGGVGPYTYNWNTSPAQTTQTATGLIAGTYVVTVTDANGCSTTASAVITQPAVLNPTISATTPICTGTTTLVDLTVTGGTGTISYSWSSSETTEDITKGAGTYTVTVTDGNLCTATASTTITNFATPTITSNEVPQVCLSTAFSVTATSTQSGNWSAQAYGPDNIAVGAPQTSLAALTMTYNYPGSAVSDTIYIVYTFTSSVGGCTYTHTTEDIKMSGEPRLRIYRVASDDNSVTINQNTATNFHFMVDNACGTDAGTRLAITYTILKDGLPVANLTDYITNANSFRYQMPLAGSGLEAYYPDFNYTTTLTQAPAAHFPLATSSGAVLGSDQFDFFSLAFFQGREGTVSINNFTEPGVYTIEYALITNYTNSAMTIQHGNQIGVMTSLTPAPLGGNQFFTGTYYTKVWSTNTMTITVLPVGGPTPDVIETPEVAVRPAEERPELVVYPNPSTPSQAVNVELSNIKGDAILTVTSINGNVIERMPVYINEGQKSIVHTIYNTVPGMYFITITTKETIITKKLIVQPK